MADMSGVQRRLRVSAHWSALPSLLGLWVGISLAVRRLMKLPRRTAAAFGAALTLGHVFSEVWHQLGHAVAAALVGFPMSGLRFWTILSTTIYPRDEPALPPNTHIQRAIGGPIASAFLALLFGAALRSLKPSLIRRACWVLFLENLIVFTLQVFVPLGFNDGATIKHWMNKRK